MYQKYEHNISSLFSISRYDLAFNSYSILIYGSLWVAQCYIFRKRDSHENYLKFHDFQAMKWIYMNENNCNNPINAC